jgi:hypothetical protein
MIATICHAARCGDHADLTARRRLVHAARPHNWDMHRLQVLLIALFALVATRGDAAAGDPSAPTAPADPAPIPTPAATPAPRATPDATLGSLFRGPFHSSRLFAMPTADVVGAYLMTLSGDGSLLEQPGVLTSAGVLAIGFGDLAQLEYRHTEAIGLTGVDAPVPAVGVQLRLPIPERSGVPAIGVAFRLGVPRSERYLGDEIDETVTDLFLVGRLRFASVPWLTLHGGARISFATAVPSDDTQAIERTLWLPTAGVELAMNPATRLVGEAALAPQFQWDADPSQRNIRSGMLGRLGIRWRVVPAVVLDASLGLQLNDAVPSERFDAVVTWDIRLGAEVFVPWGALACRAFGVFCQ